MKKKMKIVSKLVAIFLSLNIFFFWPGAGMAPGVAEGREVGLPAAQGLGGEQAWCGPALFFLFLVHFFRVPRSAQRNRGCGV